MQHINELSSILNQFFNWNKARITCLAQMVRGIIAVKTVNLTQVALAFSTKASSASSYRRIQRFFKDFDFDPSIMCALVFSLFSLEGSLTVLMDRTNWKLGKMHLNLLVISIAYYGVSIPLFWINLNRGGSSSTDQRIFCILKIVYKLGKSSIGCVVGDREFIGKEWFLWLIENKIDFVFRIKSNTLVKTCSNDRFPSPAYSFFRKLKNKRKKSLKQKLWIGNLVIYLSASRSRTGDLLVVATPRFNRRALKIYKIRWQIENLFSSLKSKGFNLEDTHLTEKKKVEKLFFVLVIAFCWSYLVGVERNNKTKIPIKTHGRMSQNIIRYGYDSLRKAVLQSHVHFSRFYRFLKPHKIFEFIGDLYV